MNESEVSKRRQLVLTWLRNATVGVEAQMLNRLVRYQADNGWRAVLALHRQASTRDLDLANEFGGPLAQLLRYQGENVVDRVVELARRDRQFRLALAPLQRNPRIAARVLARIGVECGWSPRPRVEHQPEIVRAEVASQLEIDPPITAEAWRALDEPRTDAELAAMAQAWIEHVDTFWAFAEVLDLTMSDDADETWDVILELVQEATTDRQLWDIGAGPLEDFLGRHGKVWIERVEAQAFADPKLCYALARCWKAQMSDAVWERVHRASERGSDDRFFTA